MHGSGFPVPYSPEPAHLAQPWTAPYRSTVLRCRNGACARLAPHLSRLRLESYAPILPLYSRLGYRWDQVDFVETSNHANQVRVLAHVEFPLEIWHFFCLQTGVSRQPWAQPTRFAPLVREEGAARPNPGNNARPRRQTACLRSSRRWLNTPNIFVRLK